MSDSLRGDTGPSSRSARNPLFDEPDAEAALSGVFGIDPHLHRTYGALCDHRGCTVDELAGALDRDPSNVGRSLKRLREKGLADRWRDVLATGGQVYYHTATPPSEVRAMMDEALSARTGRIREHIESFGRSITEP